MPADGARPSTAVILTTKPGIFFVCLFLFFRSLIFQMFFHLVKSFYPAVLKAFGTVARHEIHDYNTRGANQLHMEQYPTNIGLKGMRYYGAKLWNNIFLNFTDVNSIYSVKVRFKNMLLDNNSLEDK